MSFLNLGFMQDSIVMKHDLQAETQADLIATQILYDARFDPRMMATFMQRLSNQRRALSTEFFTDHPMVTNRAANVRREMTNIGPLTANLRGDSPDLHTTQQRLRAENARGPIDRGTSRNAPPLPSSRMVNYYGDDMDFRYPENWRVTDEADGVTVTPTGGMVSGALAYGMRIGTFQPLSSSSTGFFGQNSLQVPGVISQSSLRTATTQFLDDLRRSNPAMRTVRILDRRAVDNEPALFVEATNDSPVGGRESNWIVTVLRPEGLYYFIGVTPESEINRYTPTFDQIVDSVRFRF
jgi:hypothetical protein